MSEPSSPLVEVGVLILVLKVFADFAKYAFDKISARRNNNGDKKVVDGAVQRAELIALARDTNRAVHDVHTSVVAPDRVPLISQVAELCEKKRRS